MMKKVDIYTSFYLTKDGMFRKSPKSELSQEIKKCLPSTLDEIPINEMNSPILIDFMAYCRKVPAKKLKLQTYEDVANPLRQTFQRISFNLAQSIKQGEPMTRSKGEVLETTILSIKQASRVKLEKFWDAFSFPTSSNKMHLKQIFNDWISDTYSEDKPV